MSHRNGPRADTVSPGCCSAPIGAWWAIFRPGPGGDARSSLASGWLAAWPLARQSGLAADNETQRRIPIHSETLWPTDHWQDANSTRRRRPAGPFWKANGLTQASPRQARNDRRPGFTRNETPKPHRGGTPGARGGPRLFRPLGSTARRCGYRPLAGSQFHEAPPPRRPAAPF